jgi:superfamily II DNA/RNA helicase
MFHQIDPRSVCLFGGVSRNPQINQLQRGVDMVIATPGDVYTSNDFVSHRVVRRVTKIVLPRE